MPNVLGGLRKLNRFTRDESSQMCPTIGLAECGVEMLAHACSNGVAAECQLANVREAFKLAFQKKAETTTDTGATSAGDSDATADKKMDDGDDAAVVKSIAAKKH